MRTVYTIGYSLFHTPEEMIDLLQTYGITCVVDVRSSPYSAYYADFNKEPLAAKLKQNNILYRNYAKEFGARQNDPKYTNEEGYLEFDRFTQSEAFLDGVGKLINGIELGYTFVLMCAEQDPIDCHRGIMIGKSLKELGFKVIHIVATSKTETQEEMEIRGIGNQISMFDGDDPVNRFYKERERKIAYRPADHNI